jgi:tRNA threonylcarbamoyladenosine biosynthesis protein TsaE
MKEILILSPEKIPQSAKEFVNLMKDKKIFAFYGEMGAGKTTFIKAVCRELGVCDTVSSPSFALVYEYRTPEDERIYHFDLYRINDTSELFDLGYEDYFYSGNKCFIEWPEKAEHLLPEDCMRVNITVSPDGSRIIKIKE